MNLESSSSRKMSLRDGQEHSTDLFGDEIEQTEAEIAAKQARLEAMRLTQTEAQNCMGQLQQLATTVEGLSPSALQAFKRNVMKLFGTDDEPPTNGSNGGNGTNGRGFANKKATRERNALVTENLNLVRRLAHDFAGCCRETYSDLEQVGTIGLIKAVERYDPERKIKLSTFAVPYIRGAILHHLRDLGHLIKIPRAWQEKYNTVMKRHRVSGGTIAAIASELNIKDWHEIEQAMSGYVGELNENTAQELADSLDVFDQVEAENLHTCLQQLDSLEQLAINAVWFQELSPRRAANVLKVSFKKLQELCQSGIEKLRLMLTKVDEVHCPI